MKSKTFRRISVVKDNLTLLEELKTLFESELKTVVTISDGDEAHIVFCKPLIRLTKRLFTKWS